MRDRTALLVVDVQWGAFDGELCPIIVDSDRLLANIARLIDAARLSKMEIVFVQHCAPTDEVFEEGTDRWQIHPGIGLVESDIVVRKYESSAFRGTSLHEILQSLGVGSLVVCGLQSERCVSNTVLSALDLGYVVTIVQDAHSTWPDGGWTAEQIVDRQNKRLSESGAVVASTSELI